MGTQKVTSKNNRIESEVCYGKAQELRETKSFDRDQKLCRMFGTVGNDQRGGDV